MQPRSLLRQAHFLGTKIRNLRKRNHLTLEDVSVRCMQINPRAAPSVSYLSMIETGKRVPSGTMLQVIAEVFQQEGKWFLDEIREEDIVPIKKRSGGVKGMALEPGFLFTREHLEIAIPEMLSQSGITGRQFAHLLIRTHQEQNQNRFPDLEKAAEEVGKKQMPLHLEDILGICKDFGLTVKWFDRAPDIVRDETDSEFCTLVRSFFEPPGTVYINSLLQDQPARLKYDLATHIAHCVLHNRDGLRSVNAAGGGIPRDFRRPETESPDVDSINILHAWRDFECSFFAGALLCPRIPFRQLLTRHAYDVNIHKNIEVTRSVLMRRMTAVSPYPYWHYFDAYPPGILRAVYRGNGIPLPWGNMRMALDPCRHWAVFRMLHTPDKKSSAQISILKNDDGARLYCCESVKVKDAAGNDHVICAGIDLVPVLESQGKDAGELIAGIEADCIRAGGSTPIAPAAKNDLLSAARILNINWVEKGLEGNASIICPRSSACPRTPGCVNTPCEPRKPLVEEIRAEIMAGLTGE